MAAKIILVLGGTGKVVVWRIVWRLAICPYGSVHDPTHRRSIGVIAPHGRQRFRV